MGCSPRLFLQAAYLVGIADPNSEAGTQGLVDQTQFARANQAIQMACQSLIDPSSNQTQVKMCLCNIVNLIDVVSISAYIVLPVSTANYLLGSLSFSDIFLITTNISYV